MLTLCFLLCGKFEMRCVWERWLTDAKSANVVVFHSNASEEEQRDVVRFCTVVKGTLLETFPTAWCTLSLLIAELKLYDMCVQMNFQSAHMWLVSEKTLPLLSYDQLLPMLPLPHVSLLQRFPNPFLPINVLKMLTSKFKIPVAQASNQFKLLSLKSWINIREFTWNIVNSLKDMNVAWNLHCEKGDGLPPEEWVIATTLKYKNMTIVNKPTTYARFGDEGYLLRAEVLSLEYLSEYLTTVNKQCTCFCFSMRKFVEDDRITHLLIRKGILS